MAKRTSGSVRENELSKFAKEFKDVVGQLKDGNSQLFKSGIELIKLTAKVGDRVEFSVVIAGKDAPKVEVLPPDKNSG